jgi:hypothetical protein
MDWGQSIIGQVKISDRLPGFDRCCSGIAALAFEESAQRVRPYRLAQVCPSTITEVLELRVLCDECIERGARRTRHD